jgi:hypothetical protein
MRRLIMTAAALLAALGPVLADGEKTGAVRAKPRLAAPAAPPLPFLVHNGSLMSQVFDPTSGHLLIQYKDPRPGLSPVGVIPGTVLFDGQIQGPVIAGTAFVFSGFCPPHLTESSARSFRTAHWSCAARLHCSTPRAAT